MVVFVINHALGPWLRKHLQTICSAGKGTPDSLMSFFGFPTSSLEEEKRKFQEGNPQESEDLAVYTWGEDSYDGLGDALVEGGDELNDETFGGADEVGKS